MTFLEADKKIKELLNKEFLEKLTEVARLYGWRGDYCEIRWFMESLHERAELDIPELEPYDLTDE
jgi:hypothetical protein